MERQSNVETVKECAIVGCGDLKSERPEIQCRDDLDCECAEVKEGTVGVGATGSGAANGLPQDVAQFRRDQVWSF